MSFKGFKQLRKAARKNSVAKIERSSASDFNRRSRKLKDAGATPEMLASHKEAFGQDVKRFAKKRIASARLVKIKRREMRRNKTRMAEIVKNNSTASKKRRKALGGETLH